MTSPRPRFFDTRAAYILFANATTEKAVVAERVGREVDYLHPRPPGLRVFDAGALEREERHRRAEHGGRP